jgi:hypothetical protein
MPTTRRRRQYERRVPAQQSERTVEKLQSGDDWHPMFDGPALSDDELRKVWRQLRSDLLDRHIKEKPGTRPWAWWRFESTEPREQVSDGPEPIGPPDWFGKPSRYLGQPPENMYESQVDYLERLGLLTDDERELLGK